MFSISPNEISKELLTEILSQNLPSQADLRKLRKKAEASQGTRSFLQSLATNKSAQSMLATELNKGLNPRQEITPEIFEGAHPIYTTSLLLRYQAEHGFPGQAFRVRLSQEGYEALAERVPRTPEYRDGLIIGSNELQESIFPLLRESGIDFEAVSRSDDETLARLLQDDFAHNAPIFAADGDLYGSLLDQGAHNFGYLKILAELDLISHIRGLTLKVPLEQTEDYLALVRRHTVEVPLFVEMALSPAFDYALAKVSHDFENEETTLQTEHESGSVSKLESYENELSTAYQVMESDLINTTRVAMVAAYQLRKTLGDKVLTPIMFAMSPTVNQLSDLVRDDASAEDDTPEFLRAADPAYNSTDYNIASPLNQLIGLRNLIQSGAIKPAGLKKIIDNRFYDEK